MVYQKLEKHRKAMVNLLDVFEQKYHEDKILGRKGTNIAANNERKDVAESPICLYSSGS